MKQLGIETVGGRIRKARNDKKMTIKAFSEAIGVSDNYLGLVERGERTPSPELVRKISRVMNVPRDWLLKGVITRNESTISTDRSYGVSSTVKDINPRLFLSLVLQRAPNVTRETLSMMLMTPPETIEKILNGEPVEFDPRWENSFPLLAQHMDLISLCKELYRLTTFLQGEEITARHLFIQRILLPALKQKAAEDYGEFFGEVETELADLDPGNPASGDYLDFSFTQIRLKSIANPSRVWCINYYPYVGAIDNSTVEALYNYNSTLANSNNCKVSIALQSVDAFNELCKHFDKLDSNNDALAAADLPCMTMPDISVILYDKENGDLDEYSFPPDEY